MLASLCDPELLPSELRPFAATDPDRTRRQYREFVEAAERYLRDQPSARTVRTAGLHLHRGLTGLVNDVAGGKPW